MYCTFFLLSCYCFLWPWRLKNIFMYYFCAFFLKFSYFLKILLVYIPTAFSPPSSPSVLSHISSLPPSSNPLLLNFYSEKGKASKDITWYITKHGISSCNKSEHLSLCSSISEWTLSGDNWSRYQIYVCSRISIGIITLTFPILIWFCPRSLGHPAPESRYSRQCKVCTHSGKHGSKDGTVTGWPLPQSLYYPYSGTGLLWNINFHCEGFPLLSDWFNKALKGQ